MANHATSGRRIIRPATPSKDSNVGPTFVRETHGTIVELAFDPKTGKVQYVEARPGAEPQVIETWANMRPPDWLAAWAASGGLWLPRGPAPCGSLDDLADRMGAFIRRYWEADEQFVLLAVAFALHTWVYEAFQAVPYLRLRGLPGTGKSRGLETIGALCYRGLKATSATGPSLFRAIEVIGGTLLLDEADFQKTGVGAEIAKILNAGYQRNSPILRTGGSDGNFEPQAFDAFGPKILSGRREFDDKATESRCLSYLPTATKNPAIPTQLPPAFNVEAQALQDELLSWRLANLATVDTDTADVPDSLTGRPRQIMTPLYAVVAMMERPNRYRAALESFAAKRIAEQAEINAESAEAKLVEAYVSYAQRRERPTVGRLASDVQRGDYEAFRWLTPRKAGALLREMGFDKGKTNTGYVASIDDARLAQLCERFGLTFTPDVHEDKPAA